MRPLADMSLRRLLDEARVDVDRRLLCHLLGFDVLVNVFDQKLAAFTRDVGDFVDGAFLFEALDEVRYDLGAFIGTDHVKFVQN
jgi:hypothetical protein